MRYQKLIVPLGMSVAGFWAGASPAHADNSVPGPGFDYRHYQTLCTKPPFAIATAAGDAPTNDYVLMGVALIDGVDYVSVVNKQTKDRFLLWKRSPRHDLGVSIKQMILVSVSVGKTPVDTFAIVQYQGQSIRVTGTIVTQQEIAAAQDEHPDHLQVELYRPMIIPNHS